MGDLLSPTGQSLTEEQRTVYEGVSRWTNGHRLVRLRDNPESPCPQLLFRQQTKTSGWPEGFGQQQDRLNESPPQVTLGHAEGPGDDGLSLCI